MDVTVKAFLQRQHEETEVRRVSVTLHEAGGFSSLQAKLCAAFPSVNPARLSVTWQDSDGDMITMSTDEELQEALNDRTSDVLKVFIFNADGSGVPDDTMDDSSQKTPLPEPEVYRPEGNIQCPPGPHSFEMGPVGMSPLGIGPPGMCPPGMGPPGMGPLGWMHPPPPTTCEPCGPCPPHGGMMFGRRGRGGRHGGGGHGWMKRHGPGGRVTPRGDGEPEAGGDDHCGWRRALKEAVPSQHRRWAKLYIHKWRKNNVNNATTTSGSDTDKTGSVSQETAGVPEAYVVWLDMVLPRFHAHWEKEAHRDWAWWDETMHGEADGPMASIKMSVPVEFRKWAWWFLARRYGKRSSPQMKCGKTWPDKGKEGFKGQGHGRCGGRAGYEGRHGGWWGKMKHVAEQVPWPVRQWAKQMINIWRLDHQLPVVTTPGKSGNNWDAADVPEDYAKWLLIFLGRWHSWRNLIEKSNTEPALKGQFKDSVPQEFRAWVKCFLCKHYGQGRPDVLDDTYKKYQAWIQIFKKKWVLSQRQTETVMTDSDDDAGLSWDSDIDDNDVDVNTSFKRMKLDEKMAKKIKFAQTVMSDDSDSDGEVPLKQIKHNYPGFPKLARSELFSWDGVTLTDTGDSDTSDCQIPVTLYRWLCGLMTKLQWRRMKLMHKAARRETKLARRELKSILKAQRHHKA